MDIRRAIVGAFFVMTASGAGTSIADVIELKDGRTLSGTMVRRGDVVEIRQDGGAMVRVKPEDVVRTTLTSTITPEQAATAEWTRDSALIRQASDLATIVDLHKKFLASYPDQTLSPTVKASLAQYQKLLHQNGVKFRGRWMPAAQVDVTLRQWESEAAPAVGMYKAGKLRPALEAAKKLIAQDGDNPQALAIAGLAAYRLDDFAAASGFFSALADADPSNVLAENNLAVVLFAVNRQAESLIHYTRALQAMPANRLVADNILEALSAYKGSTDAVVYQKLTRQFPQMETRLEAQMAAHGLYRWGSTWVTQPQLDRLNANVQAIKNSMAALQSQYQTAQVESGTIADQLKQATDDYNNTVSSIAYLNSQILQTGGEPALVERRDALVADLDRSRQLKASLEAKRDALVTGRPEMFAAAAKLKGALAEARKTQFTGVQRIMDLGEDENPPAPTVVALPPPPAPVPQQVVVQQVIPAPIVPADDSYNAYQRIYNAGENVVVPIFIVPPFPRGPRHHDHDGDEHGNGLQPGPIQPVNPRILPVQPVSPPFNTGPTRNRDGAGA